MNRTLQSGLAIVTGASSGIGAVYADRLAARGHDLLLIARRTERLQQIADDIRTRHGVDPKIETADLASSDDLARIEALVRQAPVEVLVNNAGLGALGATAEQTADQLESVVLLNVLALTRLSHAALEVFRTRGTGTLINLGSVSAFNPSAQGPAYSGSKAYVLNFTRSLQLEYLQSPIRIQIVQPGPIRTEFFAAAGVSEDIFPAEAFLTAEQLVDAALVGLDAGEKVSTPSLPDAELWDRLEESRDAFVQATRSGAVADRYAQWARRQARPESW